MTTLIKFINGIEIQITFISSAEAKKFESRGKEPKKNMFGRRKYPFKSVQTNKSMV